MFRILTPLLLAPLLLNTAIAFQPPRQPNATVPKTRPLFYQPARPVSQPRLVRQVSFTQAHAAPVASSTDGECQCEYCRSQRQQVDPVLTQRVIHHQPTQPVEQRRSLIDRVTQTSYTQPQIAMPEYVTDDFGAFSGSDGCSNEQFCDFNSSCCDGCSADRWVTLEGLAWWTSGSRTPALATQSSAGTLQSNAGVLGLPNTSVLFGGGDLFDGASAGFRIRGGKTIDCGSGINFEVFRLGIQNENFLIGSDGTTILGRPFTDSLTGQQNAELFSFPGIAKGQLRIHGESRMYSAAAHLYRLAEEEPGCGDTRDQYSAVIQAGPRFASLKDAIFMQEYVTGNQSGIQNVLRDSFKTDNAFLGGEVGVRLQRQTNSGFIQGNLGLALGMTRQELESFGDTTKRTSQGATTHFPGGLLAQRTNSTAISRNRFSVMPQAEFKIGFETAWGWDMTVGYNVFYWSKVLRATEQIDTNVNPNLLPPETVPFTGPQQPSVLLKESGYLAHGIAFGLEKRF